MLTIPPSTSKLTTRSIRIPILINKVFKEKLLFFVLLTCCTIVVLYQDPPLFFFFFSSMEDKAGLLYFILPFKMYRPTGWAHVIVSIEIYVTSATKSMLNIQAIILVIYQYGSRYLTSGSFPPSIHQSLTTTSRLRESDLTFIMIKRTPMDKRSRSC